MKITFNISAGEEAAVKELVNAWFRGHEEDLRYAIQVEAHSLFNKGLHAAMQHHRIKQAEAKKCAS